MATEMPQTIHDVAMLNGYSRTEVDDALDILRDDSLAQDPYWEKHGYLALLRYIREAHEARSRPYGDFAWRDARGRTHKF